MNEPKPDVYCKICPSREVLVLIGEKWCSMAISSLATHEVLRFGELKRILQGVSQKMLTQTLRKLERDGLITRKVYVEQLPLKVEYRLTELGKSLVPVVMAAKSWAENNLKTIEKNRTTFDELMQQPSE